jgi:beta-lactamase superfamily II metal-dependent hydrolase
MILEIFDVEHGACALITTSNGKHVMIDCGDNSTTGWAPGTTLVRRGIHQLDKLFVSNYDEDHVSGYPNLARHVHISVLARNDQVPPAIIKYLKSEDGMGFGIEALVHDIEYVFTGGRPSAAQSDFGDTTFAVFSNPYGNPPFGFDDENNLSFVVFVTCGSHRFIFPGDIEKAGWRALLLNPSFVFFLSGVTVFVASHHGRENGYCEEVMNLCPNIHAVIISDRKKGFQSQETVDAYRKHSRGFIYNGTHRRVLTTRRDGYMWFNVPLTGMAGVALGAAAA